MLLEIWKYTKNIILLDSWLDCTKILQTCMHMIFSTKKNLILSYIQKLSKIVLFYWNTYISTNHLLGPIGIIHVFSLTKEWISFLLRELSSLICQKSLQVRHFELLANYVITSCSLLEDERKW